MVPSRAQADPGTLAVGLDGQQVWPDDGVMEDADSPFWMAKRLTIALRDPDRIPARISFAPAATKTGATVSRQIARA